MKRETNTQALTENVRRLEQQGRAEVALCEAARWDLHSEVSRLLDNGVDVNSRGSGGATPLMYTRSKKMAQLLLNRGANVNATDELGRTPLIWFLMGLSKERDAVAYVQVLIDAGANLNRITSDGFTARDLAYKNYGPNVARLLEIQG